MYVFFFIYSNMTERAVPRVTNDLLLAANDGICSVLVLLDLRAAFNTISHSIHRQANALDRNSWYSLKMVPLILNSELCFH